ncbi:MAG: YerC/YecD family TrpR-related protein [bacterium]|nr:YerC/YecD family TrpR-related protein [bacterium]
MAQVSKHPISKAVEERIFEIFSEAVRDLKNPAEIREFFSDFLSPTEEIMLAKRLAISVLLAKEYSYEDIKKILRVSPPTISRVAGFLKYTGEGYKRVVEKILTDEKAEEFWQKIDDVLHGLVPPKAQNWSYWRKDLEEKKRRRKKPF